MVVAALGSVELTGLALFNSAVVEHEIGNALLGAVGQLVGIFSHERIIAQALLFCKTNLENAMYSFEISMLRAPAKC